MGSDGKSQFEKLLDRSSVESTVYMGELDRVSPN